MSVSDIRGGKAAVIRFLVSEIAAAAAAGTITQDEAERQFDELEQRLGTTDPVVPLPAAVPGGFVRTETIDELIHAANANYAYLMGEADTLAVAARMISYLVNGRMEAAEAAAASAAGYVTAIQTYAATKRGGANAIVVDLSTLNGVTYEGGQVVAKIRSAKRLRPSVVDVTTNGMVGNLLELDGSYEPGKTIPTYSVNFTDPQNQRRKRANIDDNNETTIYEVEAYEIPSAVKDAEYRPLPVREPVDGGYRDVAYDKAPADGELWLEVALQVPASASMVQIVPALVDGQQIVVDSVLASADGQRFVEVARDFTITPEANLYLVPGGSAAGTGLFFLPPGTINFVTLRLKTRTSYSTLIAHVLERDHDGKPVDPTAYDVSGSKSVFFSTQMVISGGETRQREVVALPAARWSIPIRAVLVTKNDYETTSQFTTDVYTLPTACSSVALSVDETVPDGCQVTYEITHDGTTWTPISPVERNGGVEVVVFGADRSGNPNVPQAAYVPVDRPVTELQLRATLLASADATPVIRSVVIQPVTGS